MPELPEVETTKRGLAAHVFGKVIDHVEVRRRDLRWPIDDALEETLIGSQFSTLRRIGKYMVMDVDNGYSIIAHLGMSGTFRVEHVHPQQLRKHDHVIITLESGEVVIFCDPRRFGFLLLVETEAVESHPRLSIMGPDPFDEERLTVDYLHSKLATKKSAIKPVLLDQALIAGIGNIYASEALFSSKIHPEKKSNLLTKKDLSLLIPKIREVLAAAIASGGSTLRDFSGGDGEPGYFQHSFQTYGRENQPCFVCENLIVKKTQAGRSTFFCENCQK